MCDAHKWKNDKVGVPYVFHPFSVACQMDTETEICVALLHDVVEDTDFDLYDMVNADVPLEIVDAVALLTKHAVIFPDVIKHRYKYLDDDLNYDVYMKRILVDPIARKVKLADMKHNSHPTRNAMLPEPEKTRLMTKYIKWIEIFEEEEARCAFLR